MNSISTKRRLTAVGAVAALSFVSACGSDGDSGGTTAAGDDCLDPSQVEMAMDNEDYMNQIAWIVANERYWPELGFCEDARVIATSDYMAGLIGGDVWVAQGESSDIWPATAEGSVDLTIIGVEKDSEAWFLGVREGVDPESLEGLKISGGPPGDRNIVVGREIVTELGADPESMEWVSVAGGSDERLQALVAGQIDAAVLQPRHQAQLEEAGGEMIYADYNVVPQEVWVVQSETLEENEEAVCAFVEGRVAAKQWLSEGDDYVTNRDAAIAIGDEYGFEPSEGEIAEWANEMTDNWSLDAGAPADTWTEWTDYMIDEGVIPEDYDWRDHVDFNCLWEAQEKLGLEMNPAPEEVESA